MTRATLLALLLATTPALAEQTEREIAAQNALRAAAAQATSLPDSDALLAACPADIYASRRNLLRDMFQSDAPHSHSYCHDHAAACAEACKTDLDGKACLALAHALEMAGLPDLELPARRYHALACALGQASGCTNRGGGMRNVPAVGDPWWPEPATVQQETAKSDCLYRSFQAACTAGDSWGCAMLGQAQALGEGTAPDAVAARQHYLEACNLAKDKGFAACVFAREALDSLPPSP